MTTATDRTIKSNFFVRRYALAQTNADGTHTIYAHWATPITPSACWQGLVREIGLHKTRADATAAAAKRTASQPRHVLALDVHYPWDGKASWCYIRLAQQKTKRPDPDADGLPTLSQTYYMVAKPLGGGQWLDPGNRLFGLGEQWSVTKKGDFILHGTWGLAVQTAHRLGDGWEPLTLDIRTPVDGYVKWYYLRLAQAEKGI